MKKESFIYKIYRTKTIERTQKKLTLLGPHAPMNLSTFLNIRLILSILLFILLLLFTNYLVAPIITVLFYIAFEFFYLDYPIKKRGRLLESEAIFFFEVVNLTLESNRNLKGSLELTANSVNNELAAEFKKTFRDMKLGKSFNESLNDMKERIPSDAIGSILLNLTESSIFGNSIIEAINTQIDYLREKRLLILKAEINKLPTKISIVSVIFFIPIMLLIILSPVLLEFLLK